MMLYVSLEQEEAVKEFFTGKGWPFQKPGKTLYHIVPMLFGHLGCLVVIGFACN